MESTADYSEDAPTSPVGWLDVVSLPTQPSICRSAASLASPPAISHFVPTPSEPIFTADNGASLYNLTGYGSYIEDQWTWSYEAPQVAFPRTEGGDEFQDITAFPSASMGLVESNIGPDFSNFGMAYIPDCFTQHNFQHPPPEIPPVITGSVADIVRPTSNPGQQLHVDAGMQQRQTPKPFWCNHPGCNSKGFKRKYELQRHMKKHSSSQRIFLCPVADCRFQQPANAFYRHDKLRCHMRSCHPDVQVPPAITSATPSQVGAYGNIANSAGAMAHNAPMYNTFQG